MKRVLVILISAFSFCGSAKEKTKEAKTALDCCMNPKKKGCTM